MKRRTSTWDQRVAEKEQARRADVRAEQRGVKTPTQIKADNEAFAFPRKRATVKLSSARSLH